MPFVGEISALLTAAFWSCSALVFAAATARAGSLPVNVARLIIAAIYLGLTVAIGGIDLRLSAQQTWFLAISGVIGLAVGDSFLFRAFGDLGPRITMLIMSTAPAVAAVLAYLLLDEGLSLFGVLGILVTLAGVALVVLERNEQNGNGTIVWRGLIYAVLAATGQGVGLIFAKMAFREGEINGFAATLVRILASLVIMLPIGLSALHTHEGFRVLSTDRRALGLTALGAVLGPFLGISFSLIAVASTSVGVAATLMATVPILMLPLVHFIHKERLSAKAIGGAVIAVVGVGILFLR
ncbi:MAG: DMT family transporter [Bacteroidota bacterium]